MSIMNRDVTFETKVWERDWQFVLNGNYLDTIIKRCKFPFAKKVLMVNNVKDKVAVERRINELLKKGVITDFYFVDDYANEVLKFFNIAKEDFVGGYYYSISELTSLYLCQTEYLLHFSGDAYMVKNSPEWISEGMALLEGNPDILQVTAAWDNSFEGAKKESLGLRDGFYLIQGFTDQCYLVNTDKFKNINFKDKNEVSDKRYPEYGGELFEKRVDAYMRNNGLIGSTSSNAKYIHANHPERKTFFQKLPFFPAFFNFKRLRY